MKLGLLFAGQGSQHPGMGKDFYENCPAFAKVFDCLSYEQRQIAFYGPESSINDTRNTQPIMVAFAAGVMAELQPNLREAGFDIAATCGLSLGEYSALCASGVFSFSTAVELVTIRANAMHEASKSIDCAMNAVLGLSKDLLHECCSEATSKCEGIVQIANLNCPGQIVIAGEKNAVEMASKLALENGAKRCIPLAVSGPFHTKYMESAGDVLAKVFEHIDFGNMQIPVYFNAIGRVKSEDETISDLLVSQVSSSVHFEDIIKEMNAAGIDTVIEIGPGKALSGFVRKTCRNIKCYNIETVDDMQSVLNALGL